jgi:hypothetical protein
MTWSTKPFLIASAMMALAAAGCNAQAPSDTQQAQAPAVAIDTRERAIIEEEIWAIEASIFEGRGRGDLSNYLNAASGSYLGWPPVLPKPLNLDGFKSPENMNGAIALRGEKITFVRNGFTMNDTTAITYFTSHRTMLGEGFAVDGVREVDEYYENTHIWTFEDGAWRLIGGMARKLPPGSGPRGK